MLGMTSPGAHHERWDRGGTDDQLAGLLRSIRKHILDAPVGSWDAETRAAAEKVSAKLATRLTEAD